MDRTNPPATEHQPGSAERPGQGSLLSSTAAQSGGQPLPTPQPGKLAEIGVGRTRVYSSAGRAETEAEVFTLTLSGETIELLPFKTWSQLDHYKWTMRGKLPAEPAGLEVAPDHVRIAGETVSLKDVAGCAKLERLFNNWLRLERETAELARKKSQPARTTTAPAPSGPAGPRFHVEVDKRGQVHVHCVQGKETLASVGLALAGFNSLHQQGLMRKPHQLAIGALHDWIDLDGELCSFEKGRNDAVRLEQLLNERYLPTAAIGFGKQVVVSLSAASSTGFDIQFPVKIAGVLENHRQHLGEQALEALQDPEHCGLLHKGILVKLIPPNLIFKRKTPDGGEQNLAHVAENMVEITDDDGNRKTFDLSQPLNFMHLSPAELTAVFNHSSINRHAPTTAAATPSPAPAVTGAAPSGPGPVARPLSPQAPEPIHPAAPPSANRVEVKPSIPVPPTRAEALAHTTETGVVQAADAPVPKASGTDEAAKTAGLPVPAAPSPPAVKPNLWLKDILAQPPIRHDWFACLTYSKLAEHFGNSSEGRFGASPCWFVSLGEVEDIMDPEFKGVFLTEKGSLGFLNQGRMARFYNGVAFVGPQASALEGIQVQLIGIGVDERERVVFILGDHYRERFGVPESTLVDVLNRLTEQGAVLMGATETLASSEPLAVVWTAPAGQADGSEPQAVESVPPEG